MTDTKHQLRRQFIHKSTIPKEFYGLTVYIKCHSYTLFQDLIAGDRLSGDSVDQWLNQSSAGKGRFGLLVKVLELGGCPR
jgi:hypothetical protein